VVLCVSMSVRQAGGPPGRRSLAVPLDDTFEHTTDIGSLNSSRILRDLCLQIVFLEKAKSPTFVRPAARPEGKGVKVLAHDRISESDVTPPHRRACVVPAPVPVPVTGALLVQPCAYILTERPGSLTSRSTSSHTMMWFQSRVHPSRPSIHPRDLLQQLIHKTVTRSVAHAAPSCS